jgi:hypothetical protein
MDGWMDGWMPAAIAEQRFLTKGSYYSVVTTVILYHGHLGYGGKQRLFVSDLD